MLVVFSAADPDAAQFFGRSDTGWAYADKRECCNAAIAMAQQNGADACTTVGGAPHPPLGDGQRGSCTWQWHQATADQRPAAERPRMTPGRTPQLRLPSAERLYAALGDLHV